MEQDERLLTDKEYMRLVKYVPIPQHDLRKVAKAQLAKAQLVKSDKHRLDRPELRKALKELKIAFLLDFGGHLSEEGIDQILALIPDEEEIKKQIEVLREDLIKMEKKLDDREIDLIEAKREEREMTLREVGELLIKILRLRNWQSELGKLIKALKQGTFPEGDKDE